MRPSRRALAALLPVLVLLPGCGGDVEAKNAYVEQVQLAQQSYVTRFDQVRRRLTATSTLAQDRTTLGDFGKATDRFADALQAVKPPGAVKAEHGKLIAAVRAYQRRVQQAAAALAKGTTEDRARVRTDLSSSIEDTQRKIAMAIGEINTGLRE